MRAEYTSPTAMPKLLVVDDQPLFIQTMHEIFRDQYEIFMARNGEQALAQAERLRPDLILLDLNMPDISGMEVCQRLKQNPALADIPVLFVTAEEDFESESLALEAGGADYITKPVNPAVVRARVRTHLTLKAQADQLRALAYLDGLTGVANRRYFDQHLDAEWTRSQRHHMPLSLILLDIDFFKTYNDHLGHIAGDQCLKAVAGALQALPKRGHDFVARYGGEEFVVLLADCDLPCALRKAAALQEAVAQLGIQHPASAVSEVVTISLGVASTVAGAAHTAGELLDAADRQLYAAKQAGRNRISPAADHAGTAGSTPP